jgi:DNA-directed RNA polymerase subunit RPC12/RpoP
MPKFRFLCNTCQLEVERYTSAKTQEIECPACKLKMQRQIPTVGSQQVNEVVDTFTGVKHVQDQKELLKDRRDTYYWEVEVPRFVEKYSTQTCLEEGWLVYNDKGELVINKPPSKR